MEIGNIEILAAYVGNVDILKIYVGETLVFEKQ